MERVDEALSDRVLALDAAGWKALSGFDEDTSGLSLETLHKIIVDLQDMASTHPLFVRGAQLRHAYVFGRGIRVSGLSPRADRKSTRLNSSHVRISYAVFCLKKKKNT